MFFIVISAGAIDKSFYQDEYQNWVKFKKARTYYTDYGGQEHTNIGELPAFLLKEWALLGDTNLIPTGSVIKSSANRITAAAVSLNYQLKNFSINMHKGYAVWFVLLICWIVMILYHRFSLENILIFFILLVTITALTIFRPRERIVLVYFYASFLIMFFLTSIEGISSKFEKLPNKKNKAFYLIFESLILIIISVTFLFQMSINSRLIPKLKNNIETSNKLVSKYTDYIIFTNTRFISMPFIITQPLFYEKSRLKSYNNNIYSEGWLARHPFLEKKYISKFKNYLDFLTSKKVVFLGSGKHNRRFNNLIMKILETAYGRPPRSLKIKVIDRLEKVYIYDLILDDPSEN